MSDWNRRKFSYAEAFRGALIFSLTFYIMGFLFRTLGEVFSLVMRILYAGG